MGATVRFLFCTYCIELSKGQLQIGVYKRGLRVALELRARGHEIVFYCTGHQNFHDELTARAKSQMRFIELTFRQAAYEGAEANRVSFLEQLRALQPDVVVIGEAPMAGPMLEMTLCAVETKIPVVVLDNAYHPAYLETFCEKHGAMVDGIVLSGPSAVHGVTKYRYVVHVPPYIDASVPEARALLGEIGVTAERFLLVLGYDPNVERLGLSLARQLDDPNLATVVVSPDPEAAQRRADALVGGTGGRIRAIAPTSDRVLFGLLQLARCAVTKCGYMQVAESLSVGTPVVTLYYPGFFSLTALPEVMQRFAHATTSPDADPAAVAAARRFLETDPAALRSVHEGGLGAAAQAAEFLERLPRTPRGDATEDSAAVGFTPKRIQAALRELAPRSAPVVREVRATSLRDFPDHRIWLVACRYSVGDETRFVRLWGRLFTSARALIAESRRAAPGRRILYVSGRERMMLELDLGEEVLPSIVDLIERASRTAHG